MRLAAATLARAATASLSSEHVQALLANGGQIIDVRSPADYRRSTLPGALNLPIDALCYEHRRLNTRRPVIVYGNSRVRCARAARFLAGKGFEQIYHLTSSD